MTRSNCDEFHAYSMRLKRQNMIYRCNGVCKKKIWMLLRAVSLCSESADSSGEDLCDETSWTDWSVPLGCLAPSTDPIPFMSLGTLRNTKYHIKGRVNLSCRLSRSYDESSTAFGNKRRENVQTVRWTLYRTSITFICLNRRFTRHILRLTGLKRPSFEFKTSLVGISP